MYQSFQIEKDYPHVYQFLKDNSFSERYLTFLRKELGYIKINGIPVNIKAPLHRGDVLEVIADNDTKTTIMQCVLPLDIVYEDAYYLLINKPAGISTIPTRSHYDINLAGAVMNYLTQNQKNVTLRILNRLDKDTAGLVLITKNLLASNALKETQKVYFALCKGEINKEITIDKPIATLTLNGINQRKRIISPDGKPAITYVTPIQVYHDYSLIKLTLTNGRTHQIRVHLSSIGHPLLGDEIYGETDPRINHTALLCKELSFYHPFLKKQLNFSVDYPDDFKALL